MNGWRERNNIEILCATPGRLVDMLDSNKVTLEYVTHIVVDEADNIIDLGLESKIRDIILHRYS